MRIAILVCAYPPFKGGIGNAAAGHAGALVELGHEVDVLCPAHDSAPGTSAVDGVTVRRLRPVVSHGLSAFLPGLARRVGDYDGLLLEYPFFGGAEPAVLGARLSKIPYLVYFHMDVIWGGVRGAFLAVHRHIGAPWVLRGARQVLVSSFDYARHSSIAHLNLPNLCELPYSVDTHAFTPAAVSAERRRELGIDLERPVVLFVGTMNDAETFKGVDRLLSAMAQGGLGERAQVVLAGEGNRRPGYMRMAAESLPGRVVSVHGRRVGRRSARSLSRGGRDGPAVGNLGGGIRDRAYRINGLRHPGGGVSAARHARRHRFGRGDCGPARGRSAPGAGDQRCS